MVSLKSFLNSVAAVVSLNLCILFGGYDDLLRALIVMIVIDYLTGLTKAAKQKELNSYTGYMGILKKVLMLCVVIIAVVFDDITNLDAPVLRTLVIGFYIGNEGLSIFENLTLLGVPFPQALKDKLKNHTKE